MLEPMQGPIYERWTPTGQRRGRSFRLKIGDESFGALGGGQRLLHGYTGRTRQPTFERSRVYQACHELRDLGRLRETLACRQVPPGDEIAIPEGKMREDRRDRPATVELLGQLIITYPLSHIA
jgi:hypothetical protein